MKHIPIVDLQGSLDAHAPAAQQSARELFDALSQIGFAYIAGHNVAAATREAAFAASRLRASTERKMSSASFIRLASP